MDYCRSLRVQPASRERIQVLHSVFLRESTNVRTMLHIEKDAGRKETMTAAVFYGLVAG